MAVGHDENKPNALEILQVPLETGKLYHNEKLFFLALSHLRKESRSFRLGWSIPFFSNKRSRSKDLFVNEQDMTTRASVNEKEEKSKKKIDTERNQKWSRISALTPIILSGLLASLDNIKLSGDSGSLNPEAVESAITSTSTELVNYAVGMRRAALTRVRVKIKRERTQRVIKPVFAIVACVGLYSYAWSSLQRLLVGFYGVTNIVISPPESDNGSPVEQKVDLLRLMTSPCRARANTDHYGHLSNYAKACRITEAMTFELLTSPHNSHHTKLFARRAYDEIEGNPSLDNNESLTKLLEDLMQYDDDYVDDTELPLYAMHTTLGDNESSMIPLDDVIHGRRIPKDAVQRQRWKRKRRRQQKYDQQEERTNEISVASTYARLSAAVQFWGDTTVNHLVREAIVQAHSVALLPSKTSDFSSNKLKLLDVGSGMSGTLFSLCTPEFPFKDWSYHGISVSQPEVRRANQLVDTVVRPIITSSQTAPFSTGDNKDSIAHNQDSGPSTKFPLSNITIQRASFDDPLPLKEYTTMIAIESLAFSHNITNTLMNLARSLKPKGTLIVVEDVVAPWASAKGADKDKNNYIAEMTKASGKHSLLTHEEWLDSFAAAGLAVSRVRDLMLEFDALSMDSASTSTASAVTGLPFIGLLIGEKPWFAIGHSLLKSLVGWVGRQHRDDNDDDGDLSNRALYLMEDMIVNERGNAYRRAAHNRADLGYYMYICTKR